MVKSQIYFLSLLASLVWSCEQREWYQRADFTEEEKQTLGIQVRRGGAYHYQGSIPEQFHLEEAMKLDSSDADLWREIATAPLKRGIADRMYYYYGEAVKRKPGKWAGFRGYIYLYFYRDYDRAIKDFNLGDDVNGQVDYSQGQSHDYMRGICYYGLKDYETAITYLDRYINKVIADEGESWVDVYAVLYKGLALMQLKRLDEAVIEFDRALKYYPKLSDCFYHKAKIYISRGQFDLAMKELNQAEAYHSKGYYHQRPYVEVLEQIYIQDIKKLMKEISTS